MSGLEVVIRPIVFPNIRPAPARALAPEDNPDQGIATLSGSGGRLIDLPHSWSVSVSDSATYKEAKRLVDTDRIYQMDESGNINKQNYVDVERAKEAKFEQGDPIPAGHPTFDNPIMTTTHYEYIDAPKPENVETIETDKVITSE